MFDPHWGSIRALTVRLSLLLIVCVFCAAQGAEQDAPNGGIGKAVLGAYAQLCKSYSRTASIMGYGVAPEGPLAIEAGPNQDGRLVLRLSRPKECFLAIDPADGALVSFDATEHAHVASPAEVNDERAALDLAIHILKELGARPGDAIAAHRQQCQRAGVDCWRVVIAPRPVGEVALGGGWGFRICAKTGRIDRFRYDRPLAPSGACAVKMPLKDAQRLALELLQKELNLKPEQISFGDSQLGAVAGSDVGEDDEQDAARYVWWIEVKIARPEGQSGGAVAVDCFTRKAHWIPRPSSRHRQDNQR